MIVVFGAVFSCQALLYFVFQADMYGFIVNDFIVFFALCKRLHPPYKALASVLKNAQDVFAAAFSPDSLISRTGSFSRACLFTRNNVIKCVL